MAEKETFVTVASLNTTRSSYKNGQKYEALYGGGELFDSMINDFLPRNKDEPAEIYDVRRRLAHYVNYCSPIVNYFISWVFSKYPQLQYKLKSTGEVVKTPDSYMEFFNSCDRSNKTIHSLLRDAYIQALVHKKSWILMDAPRLSHEPKNKKEWEEYGGGSVYLTLLTHENIIDYEIGEDGQLEWVTTYFYRETRESPLSSKILKIDTWTIWDRENWTKFEYVRPEQSSSSLNDKTEPLARLVDSGPSPIRGKVPIIPIEIPSELWVMEHIASPQIESFRARNALSYSLARTSYAQRNFFLDDSSVLEAPVGGVGYGTLFGPNDKVEWDSPPAEAFSPLMGYIFNIKDEIFRTANAMALGVENNSAVFGRSAKSKSIDSEMAVIVVQALATYVLKTYKDLCEMLCAYFKDKNSFVVSGMNNFAAQDPQSFAQTFLTVMSQYIPSVTFHKQALQILIRRSMPELPSEQLNTIFDELDKNITEELVVNNFAGTLPTPKTKTIP
jgi:hypothetical protein